MSVRTQTVYFAYGSNLHLEQMIRRCPESRYLGLGVLPNYKFIINARGYANVAPAPGHNVEGLCYLLSLQDERSSTAAKEFLPPGRRTREVNVLVQNQIMQTQGDTLDKGQEGRFGEFNVVLPRLHNDDEGVSLQTLVYVDVRRTSDGRPKQEYKERIKLGVRDSIALGISAEYFMGSVREAITRPDMDDER